jgi:nicotinamide-nucleotide adenylyltransferase
LARFEELRVSEHCERVVLLSDARDSQGLLQNVQRLRAPGRELIVAIDGASDQPGLSPLPERWERTRALLAPDPNCWVTPLARTPSLPTVADQCAALRARLGRFDALHTDREAWHQCALQLGISSELLPAQPADGHCAGTEPRTRALVVARAQPFHLGHLALVQRALEMADEVIIVIASAERAFTARDPFTAGERLRMLRAGLGDSCARSWLIALPAPAWPALALAELAFVAPSFSHVIAHNPILRALAAEQGLSVAGLTRPIERNGSVLSATAVRTRLAREGAGAWLREYLPAGTAELMRAVPELGQRCALIAEAGG